MIDYFKLALSRYSDFSGRSRRSEYWYFFLVNVLISFALGAVQGIVGSVSDVLFTLVTIVTYVVSLALLIPGIAVSIRRLHDAGKSGWWLLVAIIPIVGYFVLIYFLVQDSEPGANQWGPNPKTGAVADTRSHLVD